MDRDILESFLVCLRDRYRRADKANYFLEINEGESGMTVAITNQRDALSHFVSVLSSPDANEQQQREQLGNAVEHLRRAVLEPYERAVSSKVEKAVVGICAGSLITIMWPHLGHLHRDIVGYAEWAVSFGGVPRPHTINESPAERP